jgi:Flp pilus assembly protein TadD
MFVQCFEVLVYDETGSKPMSEAGRKRIVQLVSAVIFLGITGSTLAQIPMSEVRVKILGDPDWRINPDWRKASSDILALASDKFERRFGIRFTAVDFQAWVPETSVRSLETMAQDLDTRVSKGAADLALLFTARKNLETGYAGYSLFKEGLVLLQATSDRSECARTLSHEFGHMFGAVHVDNPESIMDKFIQGTIFDEPNARLIEICRSRSFRSVEFPLSRELRTKVLPIYLRICEAIRFSRARKDSGVHPGMGFRLAGGDPEGWNWPDLDDAFCLVAQIHLEDKDYEETLSACREALTINPRNLETRNLVAIALRRMGRIDEAIENYRSLLAQKPGQARLHFNLGIAYAKKNDLETALSWYKTALDLKPNFAEARNNLGETYLRLGRLADAEAELRSALALLDDYPLAHSNLAEILFRKKDVPGALAEAEKAMALNPNLPDPHNVLGNILRLQGKTNEADDAYRRALTLDPAYEKAYYNLGIGRLEANRLGEAKALFVEALAMADGFAEAHAGLGYCLLRENKLDAAIEEIKTAQKLGYRRAEGNINLSTAYLRQGQVGAAVDEARLAVVHEPDLAAAHNNLGVALSRQGALEEADQHFRRAVELDPKGQDAYINLGILSQQAGRLEDALKHYLQAVELDPHNGLALNNLAVVYFRKEQYPSAKEFAEKALAEGFKVSPQFLAELKKRLKHEGAAP